jgi:molybdenum cofactor cytidylyltransferase
VVLAAGGSSRMGRPKLAIPVRGVPMIRRVAEAALASRCREVIVVLGVNAQTYRPLLDGLNVRIVENPDPLEGMGSSIRWGTQAISPETQGVVILLADQPFVSSATIDRLIETAAIEGRRIVASTYHHIVGPPVYFQAAFFLELLTLEGERGARSVIEAHPKEGLALPLDDHEAADIDVSQDVTGLEST